MLANDKNCTGCLACVNACAYNAITIKSDKIFGHLHPTINESKCTNCHKCSKICPIINPVKFNKINECFAAFSTDEITIKHSSSGGLAYELAKSVINNNGVVCGASYTKNCSIEHVIVKSSKNLVNLCGSKYAQSNTEKCYKQISNCLKERSVLFIGTPCQVAGIKNYIPKNLQSNLITIDLICLGVPSQTLLKNEVQEFCNMDTVNRIYFRDQKNHDLYNLKIQTTKHKTKSVSSNKSYYIKCFLESLTFRESCYECPFAHEKRLGDITLGDFWGLSASSKIKADKKNGISAVLINSNKGASLFSSIKDIICSEKREITECIAGNDRLHTPAKKNKSIIRFRKSYQKTHNLKKSYMKTFRFKYLINKVLQ